VGIWGVIITAVSPMLVPLTRVRIDSQTKLAKTHKQKDKKINNIDKLHEKDKAKNEMAVFFLKLKMAKKHPLLN
jgi:hypothetical protein